MKLSRRAIVASLAAVSAGIAARPLRAAIANDALTTEEFGLIRGVNRMRKRRGLAPLALRRDLSRAARAYARRMAEQRFFAHVAPEGDGPTDRAEAAGYDWRRIGETLAAGQPTPEAVVRSWRDSPGHASIIFDPENRHVGAGYWRRPSLNPAKPELERYWVLLAGDLR